RRALSRPRADPANIFYHPDLPYRAGGRDRPAGADYADPRAPRQLRASSADRPLDLAHLDVRFDHGRGRLPDVLPALSARLRTALMMPPRREAGALARSEAKEYLLAAAFAILAIAASG